PGLGDGGVADGVRRGLAQGVDRPELLVERHAGLVDGVLADALGGDLQDAGVAGADDLHQLRLDAGGLREDLLRLLLGDAGGRHGHAGAALEIDAQRETAEGHRGDAHQQDYRGDAVPGASLADDVDATGTRVETREEAAVGDRPVALVDGDGGIGECGVSVVRHGHVASCGSVRARPALRRLAPRSEASFITEPNPFIDGFASDGNFRVARITSGAVTRKAVTMSKMVDRPRVKAKPRTSPTARTYSTTAAMTDTKLP